MTHRALALMLASLCLWISGGATLHHTDDDFDALQTFAVGQMALRHAMPAPPAVPCAACQWEQAVPTLLAFGLSIPTFPLLWSAFRNALLPALHLCAFDYIALRGPPRFLA